jgi:hypothetical protein
MWSVGSISVPQSEGPRFKSPAGNQLASLRIFMVFLKTFMEKGGISHITIASFHILSNSLFTNPNYLLYIVTAYRSRQEENRNSPSLLGRELDACYY